VTRTRRLLLFAAAAAVAGGAWVLSRFPLGPGACDPSGDSVVVDTRRRVLTLCESGRAAGWWSARIGREGVDKRRQGDRRTPLGRYALGAPVVSAEYGIFVPMGYPTDEQRRAGYTGSAIGIHGPHRSARAGRALVNLFDTTDGCVGLATDDAMSAVAAWLRMRPGTHVLIL
jgi:L,D-peptidoglycan transpeptidase YkuD (ErfK/YbiS/YcfS/YnhG family)